MLPTPPTASPTNSNREADFWYPQYELEWSSAGCSNRLPLPYNNIKDRPRYDTQESCCARAYGGQTSLACLCGLPDPPLGCPGTINSNHEADFWYPQYELERSMAGCSNRLPLPYNNINDRPRYDTPELCCARAYGGQTSMACLCGLPAPPLGCPGIARYTVVTTTTTVSSTVVLGGLIVPEDPDEKTALVDSLEDALFDVVAAGLRAGSGTLISVTITSIGGDPVRRWLRSKQTMGHDANGHRGLATQSIPVEFQSTVISTRSADDSNEEEEVVDDDVANDILTQVSSTLSSANAVQQGLETSDNSNLENIVIVSILVDPIVETTSETQTGTRPPTVSYYFVFVDRIHTPLDFRIEQTHFGHHAFFLRNRHRRHLIQR